MAPHGGCRGSLEGSWREMTGTPHLEPVGMSSLVIAGEPSQPVSEPGGENIRTTGAAHEKA